METLRPEGPGRPGNELGKNLPDKIDSFRD